MRLTGPLAPLALITLACLAALPGCGGRRGDVVLYCALDRNHAEPIVAAFSEATGLEVEAYYDVEANKSVGLRRRLQEERERPICDVFWNNEVVQTVLLAEDGLLAPYVSPEAADIPAAWRDPDGLWTGFAARARVLIVNTELLPDAIARPRGTLDFLDPVHSDRCGMARPLTGTTAAHAGAWLATRGAESTYDLLAAMRANRVRFAPGNAQVMRWVRAGELDFGFTDTDDCQAALDEGFPVTMVIPDQGSGGDGLIVIPNTVSLVAGAPHADAGRRLIDYLLGRDVERALAHGPSAQIPLRDDVERPPHVLDLSALDVATVDWHAAGVAYAENVERLESAFSF
ncbi:MAG: extracellular solute-binding protein [Planctomycetota bacterium]|jgi:iron(III) transport system substrate-binding protein